MSKKSKSTVKKSLVSSFLALLMLASCTNNAQSDSSIAATLPNDNIDENIQRVDFDEVLKHVTKGFNEVYNDQVKVTSAMSNAKLLNTEITVIVELDGETTVDKFFESGYDTFPEFYDSKQAIAYDNKLVKEQTNLASRMLKAKLIDKVVGNFDTLMNGFYAKTTYGRMEKIRAFEGVKKAYVSTQYMKPTAVSNATNVDEKTGIYNNVTEYDGSNTIVAVLDSGFDYTHEVFSMDIDERAKEREDIEKILSSTKAYQLEDGNLTIDDVYLSSKIPFAYDYADKKPDVFPVESDHGTHVSGIIGGKSDTITGIAPNTQFAWLKVFSDETGGGDNGDIINALEDAVKLGVDAINMSLGAVGGYSVEIPYGEEAEILERTNEVYNDIKETGISLLTAAGNEYSSGYQSATGTNLVTNPESGTISSPGSYDASLTVASIDGIKSAYAKVDHNDDDAIFFKNAYDSKQVEHKFMEELLAAANEKNLPQNADGSYDIEFVKVPGYGARGNYATVDVKDKVAVVERGTLSFEEKLKFANQAGAFACVIFNNVSGSLTITVGKDVPIPVALISQEAGTRLTNKRRGVLTFHEDYKAGPFMSDFSSWGPLADLKLKPEITAHGGFIYSSILGGGYDEMSGTSMATPNACGIVLVIRDYVKEKWPELKPKEVTQMVNRLLMSSATICLNEVGNPYSPRKQGAGLASLSNSTETKAYLYVEGIDKPKLELGDDKDKTGQYVLEFNINNFSDKPLEYDVGNLTMTETVSTDDNPVKSVAETAHMLNPNMNVTVGNKLTLNGTRVTVPAHTDDKITVTLNLTSEDKKYIDDNFKNGMYVEGFATLKAITENEIDLNIPYLAYYGDWLTPPMFDKTYYDVEADRVNGSISEKDKTKADLYASTPYGKYGDYYMIPLGAYIYDMPEGYTLIPATEEKAAISVDEDCIYQMYTVYLGMMRGAKKLTTTITEEKSGKVLFEKITYNNQKATYYGNAGQTLPNNCDFDFPMYDLDSFEAFANNTKLNVKMVAELDYENGDQVANNTFEFSFYVDYETPTLEHVDYITEWDQTLKKNRYYVDLDVSDNRFVQAIRPCVVKNGYLISLTDYPTPVYQDEANTTTKVRIEITDYLADIKASDYSNSLFFMINDYALNANIFIVPLSGTDRPDLAFKETNMTINANEIIDLNEYVNYDNAVLQNVTWTSSNPSVAMVNDAQLIGLKQGTVIIRGYIADFTNNGYNITITVRVKGNENTPVNTTAISEVEFDSYETLFTFEDDFEYSDLGVVAEEDDVYASFVPEDRTFEIYPTESFKLNVSLKPWYLDTSNVEIRWSSSNSRYVSVTQEGVVTAIEETPAPVSITARAYVNGVEAMPFASIDVTVKSPFIVSGIVLQYYKGAGGRVVIPDDQGIQYIGEYAFSHYIYNGFDKDGYAQRQYIGDTYATPITDIVVPEGVEIIQNYAFAGLDSLKTVSLPSTIKDIYVGAFEKDGALTDINLNDVNKIENNAFYECKSLTNINKEGATTGNDLSHVITLGSYAFYKTSISKVDLVKLRMAGDFALANNSKLTEVTLYKENPLNASMFAGSAINSITIPHSLINANAFKDCESITSVNFTANDVIINSGAFANAKELETITFADTCTSLVIGNEAFAGSKISNLVLPSGNVTIYDDAFKDSSIKTLTLKENTKLNFVGTPFVNTNDFESIVINGNNANYDVVDGMLLNKTHDTLILVPSSLKVNSIPSSVKTIAYGALAGNMATESLTIPASVTTIEPYALSYANMSSVDISNVSVDALSEGMFYGMENLNEVIGLDKLTNIPDYMLAYTGLVNVTIGDNVTIGYGAFAGTDKLTTLTMGNNVTVGEYAFYQAFARGSVTVTMGTGEIKDYAFANSNVTNVTSKASSIGVGAFYGCLTLADVDVSSATEIGSSAFRNNTLLLSIKLDSLQKLGDFAFFNDTTLQNVTVKNLATVGAFAFANTTNLQAVELKTVTNLGVSAFENSGIKRADLASLKTLGASAFENATNLEIVANLEKSSITTIPDRVFSALEDNNGYTTGSLVSINLSKITKVGYASFYGQGKLSNIDLSKVTSVGARAFFGDALGDVSLDECVDVGDFAFYNASITSLNIPKLVNVGQCAFAENPLKVLDIPDTLKSSAYGSFSMLTGLENYTHNGEVDYVKVDENNRPLWKIVDGVFYVYLSNDKWQLQSYPIASKRESYVVVDDTYRIDNYSFYGATNLKEITFPYSLETIGDCAFAEATNLKTYTFTSYRAPILECVYNAGFINYMGSLTSLTQELDDLYFINQGPQISLYMYPYFYANFVDFVGFVNSLVMNCPKNGVGYDSWIYRNYFKTINSDVIVADELTNTAIDSLNRVFAYEHADNDNKDDILQAYNDYSRVLDEDQKSLLDSEQVAHLLALYAEVIEINNPKVDNNEISEFAGAYEATDFDGNTYQLEIKADGSGVFVVDNVLNDSLDATYTFNEVRRSSDGSKLQITMTDTNNEEVTIEFSFDKETNKISLRYYVTDLDFDVSESGPHLPNPPKEPISTGLIVGLSVGGVAIIGIVVAVILIVLKEKKKVVND